MTIAGLTGDEARLSECRRRFKEVFVPNQMAIDGSFPAELKRPDRAEDGTRSTGYALVASGVRDLLPAAFTTPA